MRTLHLTGTNVIDYSPLSNLKNLEYLNLRGSQISDLRPLTKLVNLKELNLTDCLNITDEQIQKLKSALPQVNIKR